MISYFLLLILLSTNHLCLALKGLPFYKPTPKFTYETITASNNLLIDENSRLTTELLKVEATTYKEAMPIIYSLIDGDPHFTIHPITGSIIVFKPFEKRARRVFQITVVATDSAPFPDQQKSFLNINVTLRSIVKKAPKFNDHIPYFLSLSDATLPGSLIYNKITIEDENYGQEGALNVFCNPYVMENSDAKVSCEYFSIVTKSIGTGQYQLLVILTKALKYDIKQNFIISIGAKIGDSFNLYSAANMVVEIQSSSLTEPYFSVPSYLIQIDSNTQLQTNVLELSVQNVNLNLIYSNISITLNDPKKYFTLSTETLKCENIICTQQVRYVSACKGTTTYLMKAIFIQQIDRKLATSEASIYVICRRPLLAYNPPAFLASQYSFEADINLLPGAVLKNSIIEIDESNDLSPYQSGFKIELLNINGVTPATDLFELVPNFGQGLLASTLRLKRKLDVYKDKGTFQYIIKATSVSSNASSTAHLSVVITENKKLGLAFERLMYTVVLNEPESFKIDDVLIKVNAYDYSNLNEPLKYFIIGSCQDRFTIDSDGYVRLSQRIYPIPDNTYFYNMTIMATNKNNEKNFCNLVVYLNITSIDSSNSLFECALTGAKSEIDLNNKVSLNPLLFIPVNSEYELRYSLMQTIPSLDEVKIDRKSGQVYLFEPLNSTIMNEYDRVIVKAKIFQLQTGLENIYLSSIICSATIYWQSFDSPTVTQNAPYFLRDYMVTIDRESVNKTVPLIKVDAISRNPSNFMPINYKILNDNENLFVIDSTQGFIYPRYDLGLKLKSYTLLVQATDPSNLQYTQTNVHISIVLKFDNTLTCNSNYLSIRIDPNLIKWHPNGPTNLSQITCVSSSLFNDTPILYDISKPLAAFDCLGSKINYTPNIGVDSTTGRIVSFETLSRNNFCDVTFTVIAKKDQNSISIPVKIYLVTNIRNDQPIFNETNSLVITVPYYAFIGSYIGSVIAFDQTNNNLVQNYSIVSQPVNPNTYKPYFQIETSLGIIRLNSLFESNKNLALDKLIRLKVAATNRNQKSSFYLLLVDMTQILNNYYATFTFDKQLPDYVIVDKNNVNSNIIYNASATCYSLYQTIEPTSCSQSLYFIDYISDYYNSTNFRIDYQTGKVYMISSNFADLQLQSIYLIVLSYLNFEPNFLYRYQSQAYKSFKLLIDSAPKIVIPIFEFDYYSVKILDNTQAGSCILTIRYLNSFDISSIQIGFEQESNLQIKNLFFLKHSFNLKAIYVCTITGFYKYDKYDINFRVFITNPVTSILSYTQVNIKLISSSKVNDILTFSMPTGANNLINININDNKLFNSIIYKFQTNIPSNNSVIIYKILNKDSNLFYIDKNFLRFIYPFLNLVNSKRSTSLLFIKATDIANPDIEPAYTTLRINFVNLNPYFDRQPSIGSLKISIDESYPTRVSFFNLSPLIVNPYNKRPLYFYIYNNVFPYESVDTFFVEDNQLKLNFRLNVKKQDLYSIFIYLTTNATAVYQFSKPTNDNINLLFFDIKVTSKSSNSFNFVDITNYIFVEEFMQIDQVIGYAIANNSVCLVYYTFTSCEYVSNSITYNDNGFCQLFQIDPWTGFISTNYSYYSSFLNDYFLLTVTARCNNTERISTQIRAYVVSSKEKSRFVFQKVSNQPLTDYFNQIKTDINYQFKYSYANRVQMNYPLYYFDFYDYSVFNTIASKTKLNGCFYVLNGNQDIVPSYLETRKIILSQSNISQIFQKYSIDAIERCSDINRSNSDEAYIIVVLFLASFILLVTILAIIILLLCWASSLKHALLAPTFDIETIDTDSNHELINE